MDAFALVIYEAAHIPGALKLFHKALELARNQQRKVRVSSDCESGVMHKHVAADADFTKYPRNLAESGNRDEMDGLMRSGEVEELCSVLSLAVSRHFFLIVNLVHMLENANAYTVRNLEQLLQETVFDKEMLKLGWNLQSGFRVIDQTIEYLYQTATRPPVFLGEKINADGTRTERWMHWEWKIKSEHLIGERPESMKFPRVWKDVNCGIHADQDYDPQLSDQIAMACPCTTGNVDIAALLNLFCGQLKFQLDLLHWRQHRHRISYHDFLRTELDQDRLYFILNWMKSRCYTGDVHHFCQDLGLPEMGQNDDQMAYNVGDIAGIILAFEQLFASDDKRFLLGCLDKWAQGSAHIKDQAKCANRALPHAARTIQQHAKKSAFSPDRTLYEDNPKLFKNEPVYKNSKDEFSHALKYSVKSSMSWLSDKQPAGNPANLSPWEHDQYALVSRQVDQQLRMGAGKHDEAIYPTFRDYKTDLVWKDSSMPQYARSIQLDRGCPTPARPRSLMTACAQLSELTEHTPKTLSEFLRCPRAAGAAPPAGFGALPGTSMGLPKELKVVKTGGASTNLPEKFISDNTRTSSPSTSMSESSKLLDDALNIDGHNDGDI
ncbi:hypothetical protein CLAFUW4_09868 [Fulvia fulva]|uniref:Uncharacterized protein n=1 Tax=Passalora fulva TaxID=5499 RepID=A0A9Q8PIM1_PASFU|nr:uncharacterized protein CLAFUR5_12371 [Fulvia fulva]KAK4615739.1 hypothetical protein CLAFUR4_09874 [Fulvia fulva]KAK4617396.1 hypothetical protein CLAFUR0_09867 [Fulvia fulva]UJO23102.1 hypothetical protein CLAFUR5_12371 [Fulvia fulva]WPV19235.1 hypothetical protein CLAFUW4_09868 [Fulvia fulva]WPV33748.1 hypothetical protein CLAFUW7_09871 [Fulvia fulva]